MGARRALIVANSVYDHAAMRRLRSPSADADALAGVLGDRRISDFEVRLLHDETASVVQEHVEDLFADAGPDDVLLLHFSCHGVKSESGELFFAARNTRPDRLGSTAVPAGFVQRCMRLSRSRSIVLLLDCCYGGAFSEGVSVRASGEVDVLPALRSGRGRAVITASSAVEYAFEGGELTDDRPAAPSVFTSALVRGLSTGEADRDEDGLISLNELYEYVFDRVQEHNRNQTPSRDIEMQGELYLARSGRRRITPAAMPADLEAATTDSNLFTRLGAVAELRARLGHRDLGIAAGAYAALSRMAATDIRTVADAAAEALELAAVRPNVQELRFSGSETLWFELMGPPLAQACAVVPSQAWIGVAESGDGWAVTLRQPPAGGGTGRIDVSGTAGQAVIEVIAAGRAAAASVADVPAAEDSVAGVPGAAVQAAEVPAPDAAAVSDVRPVVQSAPQTASGDTPQRTTRPQSAHHEVPQPLLSSEAAVAGQSWCAGLVLLAAGLYLIRLMTDVAKDADSNTWIFRFRLIALLVLTAVAGIQILRPAARTTGLGVLIGLAAAAFWDAGTAVLDMTNDADLVGGLVPLVFADVLVLAAVVIAVVMSRRDGSARLGLANRGRVTVVVLGVVVTVGALVWQQAERIASSPGPFAVVVVPVFVGLLLAAPVVAVCAASVRWGRGLLVGWSVTYAALLAQFLAYSYAYPDYLESVTAFQVPLWISAAGLLVTVAAARR